jgi:hypothetical protein
MVSAFKIAVDDVVVDEREVVNELHGHCADEADLFVGARGTG